MTMTATLIGILAAAAVTLPAPTVYASSLTESGVPPVSAVAGSSDDDDRDRDRARERREQRDEMDRERRQERREEYEVPVLPYWLLPPPPPDGSVG